MYVELSFCFLYTTELGPVIFRQMLIVTICSHGFLNKKMPYSILPKIVQIFEERKYLALHQPHSKRLITFYFFCFMTENLKDPIKVDKAYLHKDIIIFQNNNLNFGF